MMPNTPEKFDQRYVGDYYLDTVNGRLFRYLGYQPHPTVMIENVRTGERIEGAIGCLNLEDATANLVRLEKTIPKE